MESGLTEVEYPHPLEELAILRDLLALTSGAPIDLADAEEHDPSDSDDKHCRLYDRFLNRLAELFAVERNGKFVTATMMKEPEREDCVHVWIARNNGFEGKDSREMVSTVEACLNSLAASPPEGKSDEEKILELWNHMLQIWKPRIENYRQLAAGLLRDHRKDFEATVGGDACNDPVETIWHAVNVHFFGEPSTANSPLATDEFVKIGIKMRDLCSADDLPSIGDRSPSWARKMSRLLCMAGKLKSILDTFVKVAKTDWRGYTIHLVPIACTAVPAEIPNRNLSIDSALQHLRIPPRDPAIKRYLERPGLASRFTLIQQERTHVHAEAQLIHWFKLKDIRGIYRYIGASKLPCVLCAKLLKCEGTFACRASHQHLYNKWVIADPSELTPEARAHMWAVLRDMNMSLRQHLLSNSLGGCDLRAESTVDLTDNNDSDSANDSARQILQHRREAEWLHSLTRSMGDVKVDASTTDLVIEAEDRNLMPRPTRTDQESIEIFSRGECNICERPTTRKCGFCNLDFFCSERCERRMGPYHRSKCAFGPLTTADFLFLDILDDVLPANPEVLADFGFDNVLSGASRSKLMGLYKVVLMCLDVAPRKLHEWRASNTLCDNITAAFEQLPIQSRGGYFPWFLENMHLIFPGHGELEPDLAFREQILEPAKSLLEPKDRGKKVQELEPRAKHESFMLAALLLQSWHPRPDMLGLYLDFGFCSCTNEDGERDLASIYRELIFGAGGSEPYCKGIVDAPSTRARFERFWQAHESGSLVQLMDRKDLGNYRQEFPDLGAYLSGSPELRSQSVWKLQTFLNNPGQHDPPTDVCIQYKFVHCHGPRTKWALKGLYATLIQKVGHIRLHQAMMENCLLEMAQNYATVSQGLGRILSETKVAHCYYREE